MTNVPDREQNEKVRERFTRSADVFSRFAVPYRVGDTDVIARLADPGPDDLALDLACGPGTFTLALARGAKFVIGLDLTPALLAFANKRIREERAENVALVCADATAIPFPDESVSVSACGYSLHHMSDPLAALRELARVVRRGGRLALVDMYVPEGAQPDACDAIERARDASHRHTLSRPEFLDMIEEAGFRIRSTEPLERPRLFSDWLKVAGWGPNDPASRNSRRLLEATLADDAAGFHARLLESAGNGEPEIEFIQSALFVAADKS
jgi:ubiquinone/menaquinone biosynthesis C-methylase UbiE